MSSPRAGMVRWHRPLLYIVTGLMIGPPKRWDTSLRGADIDCGRPRSRRERSRFLRLARVGFVCQSTSGAWLLRWECQMPDVTVVSPAAMVPADRLTLGATEVRSVGAVPFGLGFCGPVSVCQCMSEE